MRSFEIFAGCGGSMLGSELAGFRTDNALEANSDACETLRANLSKHYSLKENRLFEADIRNVSFSEFREIDLVCGGPPCQPFSTGGRHLGPKDGRNLFPEAIRCIRELQPRSFVFENVKGLTRAKFENYLRYVTLQLEHPELVQWTDETWEDHFKRLEDHQTFGDRSGLVYNVVARVLNAADYGVPQIRQRLFIVGFRSDEHHSWHFPEPTHSKEALVRDQAIGGSYWSRHGIKVPQDHKLIKPKSKVDLPKTIKAWTTVRDTIADLPKPRNSSLPENKSELKGHTLQLGARAYKGHTGCVFDLPSKTIKAGRNGNPGGENMLRFEDAKVRYFTVREMARLQTFPDDYEFVGAWGSQIKQIGNAVPVRLFEKISRSIKVALQN